MMTAVYREHRKRQDMMQAWAEHDVDTFRAFSRTAQRFGFDVQRADILDIGCGPNAPMSVMLHAGGARVTGVDHRLTYRWGLGFKPARYWQYAKEVGVLRAARKVAGEFFYDRKYFNSLASSVGRPLTERGLDLRAMDTGRLDFPDARFDLVHSNATWEHLSDVPKANQEVSRVLRPGGLAYIEIHLFPSLSGGHDLPWIVPGKADLDGRLPWRHLRDAAWQAPVYLNRLRERDYRKAFAETPGLEIADWITEYVEGKELLSDDVLRALPDYPAEELTKRSIIAVLKRV